jgi:hypothetical protein
VNFQRTRRTGRRIAALPVALCMLVSSGCGGGPASSSGGAAAQPTPARPASIGRASGPSDDTLSNTGLVPAGYGSLRQDDIAIKVQLQNLLVKAIPLDEAVIRVLSPDSYRALRDLQESRRLDIANAARRFNADRFRLWYVAYYGLQDNVQFSPMEFTVTNSGRQFRPLDVIPLSPGFGEQRLKQRETQSALYLFDGSLDAGQPITVTVENTTNDTWDDTIRRIERERALIRSRVSKAPNP